MTTREETLDKPYVIRAVEKATVDKLYVNGTVKKETIDTSYLIQARGQEGK